MNEQEMLPERKPTRLRGYDYSNYGAYFITICTRNRKNILSQIVGDGALDIPQVALTKIGAIVEKYILSSRKMKGIVVENYVIMPNHVHMIIHITDAFITDGNSVADGGTSKAPSPTNATIPHFISTLKRFCHIECGRKIFQRSYRDHIIRDSKGMTRFLITFKTILHGGKRTAFTPLNSKKPPNGAAFCVICIKFVSCPPTPRRGLRQAMRRRWAQRP